MNYVWLYMEDDEGFNFASGSNAVSEEPIAKIVVLVLTLKDHNFS